MSATVPSSNNYEALLRDAPLPLIAARIKRARKGHGLSHDRLGDLMGGVTRQHLIKLEQGKHRPKLEMLTRIAGALDRDVEWFLDPEVDPSPFPDDELAGGDKPGGRADRRSCGSQTAGVKDAA